MNRMDISQPTHNGVSEVPAERASAKKMNDAHDFHFLVVEMLRESRTDPGVQPPLREPVYSKQRRVAQRSHVRAVSGKSVSTLHEVVLEERNDFVVHALGTLYGSGRWLKLRGHPAIGTLMLLLRGHCSTRQASPRR
jgi:hypothetical protein